MCASASVCVRLIIFPLHALLADNLITAFGDTLTSRSKIALRNVAHFCQGGGLWDVCVGRYFLPFFFPPLALFFHCQQHCQLFTSPVSPGRGEKMKRGGREDGEICLQTEKGSSSGFSRVGKNCCFRKMYVALPTPGNLRCWLYMVYFLAYSTLNTSKFYITGPRQYKSYDTSIF